MGYQLTETGAQVQNRLYEAHISLNLSQAESITGDGTYKSPSTYVQVVPGTTSKNFSYTDGSIVYTGTEDVRVKFLSTISVESGTANTLITFTAGKNGTENTEYEQENNLTNANDAKELSMHAEFDLVTNDTIDFFVKGGNNFTINKANWAVDKD